MIVKDIVINKDLKLVNPKPKKDALVSVQWLEGEAGKETLRLMGCLVTADFVPSFKAEAKRLKLMLKSKHEIIKMIEYKGDVIGQIEVWTKQFDNVSAPSVSLLIGSPNMRGQNIGSLVLSAVHYIIKALGYHKAYTRALLANSQSNKFFMSNCYQKQGQPYCDSSGLLWQNYSASLSDESVYSSAQITTSTSKLVTNKIRPIELFKATKFYKH